MDELHEDAIQDQEQIDETVAPVEETVEEHVSDDAEKWDKVFAAIAALEEKIASLEGGMSDFIQGSGAVIRDVEPVPEETDEDDLDEADRRFYEAQKEYGYGGII